MAERRRKGSSEDEIADLYALPLEEFIANRDALAKRLRGAGERSDAAEVRKLRKPSRAAWAVNRGVRADGKAAARLVAAGKDLERAQKAALSGKSKPELKQAMAGQQEAIEEMIEVIRQELGPDRVGPVVIDRSRETLRAVAGDEELQAEFTAGRITKDREAVGFGGATPPVAARPAKQPQDGPSAAQRGAAQRKVKRAERSLDAAVKKVEAADRGVDRARQGFDAAQERHDEAERRRGEREAELDAARIELDGLTGGRRR